MSQLMQVAAHVIAHAGITLLGLWPVALVVRSPEVLARVSQVGHCASYLSKSDVLGLIAMHAAWSGAVSGLCRHK